MLELLARRGKPEAMAGSVDVVSAMAHRMSDAAVARFVSNSVIAERGADRSAGAGVPGPGARHRSAAPAAVAGAVGGRRVRARAGSRLPGLVAEGRGDAHVVLGREVRVRRVRARVERGARAGRWTSRPRATIRRSGSPAGSRPWPTPRCASLDTLLLTDLLRIEEDGARWRDIAETVDHARRGSRPRRLHRSGAAAGRGGRRRKARASRRARSRRAPCSNGSAAAP